MERPRVRAEVERIERDEPAKLDRCKMARKELGLSQVLAPSAWARWPLPGTPGTVLGDRLAPAFGGLR